MARLLSSLAGLHSAAGLLLAVDAAVLLEPWPTYAQPFLQYLPENATPTYWANTGSGGSAYDLYVPQGISAGSVSTDAHSQRLYLPPGVFLRTAATMPASLCGQNPRTISLITEALGTSDGALCGYGAAQPGQASDIWVNGGAGGLYMDHIYGASASLGVVQMDVEKVLYARQHQAPDGWSVQVGRNPNPEPTLTAPTVNTAASPFYLGLGNYATRAYGAYFRRLELWLGVRSDSETIITDNDYQAKYGLAMPV